jgi:nitrosocyanin
MRTTLFLLGAAAGAVAGLVLSQGAVSPALAAHPEGSGHDHAATGVREFRIVGTDYRGVKRWEPGTFIVYEGETVRISITNKIPGEVKVHGFEIAAFGVKEEIAYNQTKTVEFKATKAGLYNVSCHLHPAHIGGQLLVLKP